MPSTHVYAASDQGKVSILGGMEQENHDVLYVMVVVVAESNLSRERSPA